MTFKKHISFLLVAAFALPCAAAKRSAAEDASDISWTDDSADNPVSINDAPVYNRACDFATQIVPILDAAGVTEIFKDNLFCGTTPFVVRNTLDLPSVWNQLPSTNKWAFTTNIFFNQMGSSFFNGTNDGISGAIKLQNNEFLAKFEHVINKILTEMDATQLFINEFGIDQSFYQKLDLRKITGLFAGLTVQQRRAGAMLELAENREHWTASIKLPVQWYQRNYWINSDQQQAIKDAKLFPEKVGDSPSTYDMIRFARQHLIADTFGLGDTRFTLAYQLGTSQGSNAQLGGWVNIPTATAFKRGLLGNNFTCPPPGQLDLCQLLNLAEQPSQLKSEIKRSFDTLGHAYIDRLSAIFLEEQVGNQKHWGLGLILEPDFLLGDAVRWHSRISYEFQLPGKEQRYFAKNPNLDEFSKRDFGSTDSTVAIDNLQYLNNRLLEMFFPGPCQISVTPGGILIFMQELIVKLGQWNLSFGTDYWQQGAEHISDVPQGFASAAKSGANQLKVLGSLKRTFTKESHDFNLALGFDDTVRSTGIGKDFTVAVSLSWNW